MLPELVQLHLYPRREGRIGHVNSAVGDDLRGQRGSRRFASYGDPHPAPSGHLDPAGQDDARLDPLTDDLGQVAR
ncbi:MAG: hypothetical protein ACJ71T_12740 [Actinomycetales bacterium]